MSILLYGKDIQIRISYINL